MVWYLRNSMLSGSSMWLIWSDWEKRRWEKDIRRCRWSTDKKGKGLWQKQNDWWVGIFGLWFWLKSVFTRPKPLYGLGDHTYTNKSSNWRELNSVLVPHQFGKLQEVTWKSQSIVTSKSRIYNIHALTKKNCDETIIF